MLRHRPRPDLGGSARDGTSSPTAGKRWARRVRALTTPFWRDRRLGTGAAAAVAGSYGLTAAWWTPRGPIGTVEALAAIGLGVVVGALGGLAMRSRWAMLLTPVVFVGLLEVARAGVRGPTVDGIHLGGEFGLIAFVLGRGLHGVLTLVPMLLGAALGAAAARRLGGTAQRPHGWARTGPWVRRSLTAMVTVGLLGLTLGIARPATTPQILAADGTPLSGSVAELTQVPIGGHDLALMIRGDSVSNPVLLFLAGGPGGSELGAMRRHGQPLEHGFVVATFDQRGTGKSYGALEPTSTLTLQTAIADTIGVTDYLRDRFRQDKIYLVGNSWGSLLGVLAAKAHPEMFRAFIGSGQMVDPLATDLIYYQDTLAWARRTGNAAVTAKVTASGPPPYTDMLDYEAILTHETDVYPYDDSREAESTGGFSTNIFVREYSLMEQLQTFPAFMDVFTVLYPQLQNLDFRSQVTSLDVPVYLVQGGHETRARALPATEWFTALDAPKKSLVVFETSGHRAMFQQPERFARYLTDTVLPQTLPTR